MTIDERANYIAQLEHDALELPLGVHSVECRRCEMGRKLISATCHTVWGGDTIRTGYCPHY